MRLLKLYQQFLLFRLGIQACMLTLAQDLLIICDDCPLQFASFLSHDDIRNSDSQLFQ